MGDPHAGEHHEESECLIAETIESIVLDQGPHLLLAEHWLVFGLSTPTEGNDQSLEDLLV